MEKGALGKGCEKMINKWENKSPTVNESPTGNKSPTWNKSPTDHKSPLGTKVLSGGGRRI